MNTNLAHMLVRTARAYPAQAALFLGTEQLSTFAQLADRVARCAGGLRDWLGLHAGDRVVLIMKNCPQYVELLYAIWHAGLCAVPINAKLHPREIDDIVRDSGASVCFVSDVNAVTNARTIVVDSTDYHALFAAPGVPVADVVGDTLAWLFYTSGTTGKPKGVMLSHGNLSAMSGAYCGAVTRIVPGDVSFTLRQCPTARGFTSSRTSPKVPVKSFHPRAVSMPPSWSNSLRRTREQVCLRRRPCSTAWSSTCAEAVPISRISRSSFAAAPPSIWRMKSPRLTVWARKLRRSMARAKVR
ncbi:2-succinylbenzoate--CoA ligase [Cupriavidus numazuensis]|uniref:2-succinylbenzoate--CoA ligase n=1 Tax=Cupriavidus numazuensis TaxID=221992 RepID=A0ABM8TRW5_9BURK|nr:2-succinylbenzoate--CoA ligase [Cupriavidus numazuensis]